jgi:HlyD family secretion protein
MNEVDLSQLAIDRGGSATGMVHPGRHLLSRYIAPAALVAGFVALIAWATWDELFPPKTVTVVPVLATQAEVRQEGTPLFKAAGWIEPRPTAVRVAALAMGVVEKLLVREDDIVKKNQIIAEFIKDDSILIRDRALADRKLRAAELKQAKAELKAANTRLKQPAHLEAMLREAEAAWAKVATQTIDLPFKIEQAVAKLKVADEDLKGKEASKGVVSGIAIKQATTVRDSALAFVKELQGRVTSLKIEKDALAARVKAVDTQLSLLADEKKAVAQAQAQVEVAEAQQELADVTIAEAQLRLSRMTIKSPRAGRVYKLVAHPGARIGGGGVMTQMQGHDSSTIVTLYEPDNLQIRVDVRFEDLPKVQPNQKVIIENAALKKPIIGTVLFVSSLADIQKNTMEVKVAIEKPPAVFKPDMLVDVTFLAMKPPKRNEVPTEELRIYIPKDLVKQGEGGSFVWVADQSANVARKTPVKLGVTTANGLVEITSGLTMASHIIATGDEGLIDGDRIQFTEKK